MDNSEIFQLQQEIVRLKNLLFELHSAPFHLREVEVFFQQKIKQKEGRIRGIQENLLRFSDTTLDFD